MKKTISIIVSLFCFLSIFSIPIQAKNEDLMKYAPPDKHFVKSEYEGLLEQIEEFENTQFARSTLSSENQIIYEELLNKKEEYRDYLYSLKDLNEETLKNKYGYVDDQIDAIKNYDGSEQMTTRAAARVVAALSVMNYWYDQSANKTYTYVTFSGHWEGTPFIKAYDSIGIGVVGSTANFQRTSSWNTITRQDGSTVSNGTNYYYPMAGVVYKFGIGDPSGGVIKQFRMGYNAQAPGRETLMDCAAAYSHYTINISGIGLSITKTGVGVSISTSAGGSIEWYGTKSNQL